ncbi:MAG: MazG nucleotide pyrophosphohydrolase domain-containing protein [Candidatus Pacearchaeota archaeon]|jgi:NTP pyrophosphatase (non-canonical NTP hydrolase)
MSLENIQKDVDEWCSQFDPPYFNALKQLDKLREETEEVGEILEKVCGTNKEEYENYKKDLGGELADVLFVVACIANREKINLQKEWKIMMKERRYGRDNNRFKRKQ